MTKTIRYRPIVLAALIAVSLPVLGQEPAQRDGAPMSERLRVGLVLGGGGARGAAHIGVLRELERQRIPVDAIAGVSMGAIVGGLYASGFSAAELEELVASLDWAEALSDDPRRADLSFRRKQDDTEFPIEFELGLRDAELQLPLGVIQGHKLDLLLRRLTLPVSHVEDFDDLPVPFRAIATDIERGEAYVMDGGDLAQAIRASMSVPGVFAPAEIDGRLLVDGGVAANLPIDVMRHMDVDVIIAVDVEFPLYGREDLGSALTISEQMLTILMRRETRRQIGFLGADDVLIRPELGFFGSASFDEIVKTIEPGVEAAVAQSDRLTGFALDEAGWDAYLAARRQPRSAGASLAFVRILHDGKLADRVLESRLELAPGDPVDHEILASNADRLYGLELYEQVDYRLLEEDGGTGVQFVANAKSWGPSYLQFGAYLEDDFEGSTAFNLGARLTKPAVNRLGAEWRTDARLGTDPRMFTELYQPMSFDPRFFIAPQFSLQQSNLNVFAQNATVARMRVSVAEASVDFGREIANVGEFRAGLFRGLGEARVKVGDPSLPSLEFDSGGAFARLRFDTLDDTGFPREGIWADLKWTLSRPGLGADSTYDLIEGDFSNTWAFGKNSLQLGLSYATTLESDGAIQDYFPLGGFLRLSGLERGAIAGPHAGLARLLLYRQLGGSSGILDTPVYLGVSLEAGNVWQRRSDMSFDSMIMNGSIFAGLDTFIGPVYLAAGFAEGGESNFYLFFGATPR